jgi:hypothetical protein
VNVIIVNAFLIALSGALAVVNAGNGQWAYVALNAATALLCCGNLWSDRRTHALRAETAARVSAAAPEAAGTQGTTTEGKE